MELIQHLGGFLGLVAFIGLAVMVLLYFQQAREVRRLRDWAGRAPERAEAAAEQAAEAAAESAAGVVDERAAAAQGAAAAPAAAGEPPAPGPEAAVATPGLSQRLRERLASEGDGGGAGAGRGLRDRLPETRYLIVGALAVVLVAAALATSGFGLLGGGNKHGDKKGGGAAQTNVKVAVLNGTSGGGVTGVAGLASTGAKLAKQDGFTVGTVTDAATTSPFATSLVMYEPNFQTDAQKVADGIEKQFGKTNLQPMTPEIRSKAGGAKVAIVIGSDDEHLG